MPTYPEKEADTLLFLVLMEYTGYTKAQILARHEETVNESQLLKIHFAVKDLLKEKPVQYVLGKTEFYGLPFIVNSKVLIPRPETEELVEIIIGEMKGLEFPRIIDLGTGSGCIAVSLKKNLPGSDITAIDVSEFALEVAAMNANLNGVSIRFREFDMLKIEEWNHDLVFRAIVSNPPYVRKMEKAGMKRNVLEYEPELALFVDDSDPLIFYRSIIAFAKKFLVVGGQIFCEINQYLPEELDWLFTSNGFDEVSIHKDFLGNPRVLSCRNP
jgi:release factor glutamine methyltransferase